MDVDYIKLAEANRLIAACTEKIKRIRKDKKNKLLLNEHNVGYRYGFFYFVKFLTEKQKLAQKFLGKFYTENRDKMLYPASVESFLIRQYVPAIYHEIGKKKGKIDSMAELKQFCMEGLRNSVWKYTREDIKFTTFAINGIRNNITIYKKRVSREKKDSKWSRISLFSDCNSSGSSGSLFKDSFENSIIDPRMNEVTISIVDFLQTIAPQAKITEKQMFEINNFVAIKKSRPTDFRTLNMAKKKIKQFIVDNPQAIPEFARIVG
jgi:hypothetical protein